MPTRATLERRESVLAERLGGLDANVCLVLKPEFICYKVPQNELRKEMWGKTLCSSISDTRPILFLDKFHPAIFAFLALYLNHMPLFPFVNLGFRFVGYDSAMRFANFKHSAEIPTITMSQLAYGINDNQPYKMPTARKLMFAYFMGQRLGIPHFQDMIMNAIVKFFGPDGPPSPPFIAWLYRKSPVGQPLGLKRFFVDFYNWALSVHADKVPLLDYYVPDFRRDVSLAFAATKTQVVVDPDDKRKRTEPADVIVDFTKLQEVLCNGRQGRLKCRYHQHERDQMCFNLIVDDGTSMSG
ncbi:hypothetical protein T440DRAFT_386354 [Plenodomus tracheiphilus IPT5]|uniref:Uncharacterized protein n=1 Tax=Plenodomus tracheiphilus IPT5 TaxID=1408161 RepID=A0A6A7BJ53_9PLEO|nr:hypothetical protein T440DRAFT_386354 [Plenodomus tracheiphilus IPT5]